MRWRKISLVGVGLLGGSLGLAVRQRRLADSVVGYVRRPASVAECSAAGVADHTTVDLAEAVAGADLVVLCTPLAQMRSLVERMRPALTSGAIVTDVGSVKASVVRELEALVASAGAHFLGSHPMAGTEKMGVSAAKLDLFENAVCVVTPTAQTEPEVVRRLTEFWRAVGTRVVTLPPELHDELVARCSHLPHLVAAHLVNCVLDPTHPAEQALLCANGFKDTTRIASGSPEMWRDIMLANRETVIRVLDGFLRDLQQFRRTLQVGDAPSIEQFFTVAKQRRDQWQAHNASPSPE